MTLFVAFEGIDGAGKTTTAPLVARKLASWQIPVLEASKRSPGVSGPFAKEQLHTLAERLWGVPHDDRLDTVGGWHWIFLNAAYFSGLHYALSAELGPDAIVVFDNWINKFVARITSNGSLKFDEVLKVLEPLPQPDMVFLLDVPPMVASARKESASDLERGPLQDGRRDFAAYQSIIRDSLLQMADQFGWTVISPGGRTPDEVADEVAGIIRSRAAGSCT